MIVLIFRILGVLLISYFLVTQLVHPLWTNRPIFPYFRKNKQKILEDEFKELNQKVYEDGLVKRNQELSKSLNKDLEDILNQDKQTNKETKNDDVSN